MVGVNCISISRSYLTRLIAIVEVFSLFRRNTGLVWDIWNHLLEGKDEIAVVS